MWVGSGVPRGHTSWGSHLLGIRSPYLALSIQGFWRRRHITLSTFLRDSLYVPSGGGRCGRARTCFNLMVTMMLGACGTGQAGHS